MACCLIDFRYHNSGSITYPLCASCNNTCYNLRNIYFQNGGWSYNVLTLVCIQYGSWHAICIRICTRIWLLRLVHTHFFWIMCTLAAHVVNTYQCQNIVRSYSILEIKIPQVVTSIITTCTQRVCDGTTVMVPKINQTTSHCRCDTLGP